MKNERDGGEQGLTEDSIKMVSKQLVPVSKWHLSLASTSPDGLMGTGAVLVWFGFTRIDAR